VLDDRKPQAGAAGGAGGVAAVEALEQSRQVNLARARAVVSRRQHEAVVLAVCSEDEGRAVTGIADRVLRQVVRDHAKHPGPQRDVDRRVSFDAECHAGARRRTGLGLDDIFEHRQRGGVPE